MLAQRVVAQMTLSEKLGVVNLTAQGGYENRNTGVPRLCIPALTLQDSPNGIAYGATGVTQLPASIGLAATFDTALAYQYGQVEGQEAKGKGIDVVQGPELNLDRVPQSGRAFEAYGEDPVLTADLGVANIEGIQSEGVMANAKHYTAYNQETARLLVNEVVSTRALEELYQLPFRNAVEFGHVASLMCSYGSLNGVNDCSAPSIYRALTSWGFQGFVRSDLRAVRVPVPAFKAGMSMIKPEAMAQLRKAIADNQLAASRLNDAVKRVLVEMFRFHMIERPLTGKIDANVATSAHAAFALKAAERSIVLLKNIDGVLPLVARKLRSVAVIGDDAGAGTMSAGRGSAYVVAPFVITPLAGLRAALGSQVKVTYTMGGGAGLRLAPIPSGVLGTQKQLTPGLEAPEFAGSDPAGVADIETQLSPLVTKALVTASAPATGQHWSQWSGVVVPPHSGSYTLSLTQGGDAWLYVDDHLVIASAGLHGLSPWSATLSLVGGRRYTIRLTWFAASPESEPTLGWAYQSPAIAAAVRAAKSAQVAIVFVNDYNSEGADRPSLSLPGDQNDLIRAVASANPRTVVVLNTGGPVLMPWLSHVAGVLEAWYPGEEGGRAIANVLTGRIDPSGHLPVTFPSSASGVAARTASAFPGSNATITYSEGLDIGYRYQQVNHLRPLFAFGFGLSYTTFAVSNPSITARTGTDTVTVRVSNTGHRVGQTAVQAYIAYPSGSAEPPHQLRAFATVSLQPGQSKLVSLSLDRQSFEAYLGGRFTSVSGTYTVAIGLSSAQLPMSLQITPP